MEPTQLEQILGMAMGSASTLFMSNPQPGTKQVMPQAELLDIAAEERSLIKKLIFHVIGEDEPILIPEKISPIFDEVSEKQAIDAVRGITDALARNSFRRDLRESVEAL
ncbi:hypothetical protein [Naasia lichenicola]|uniref:Uncharacterized protein n=1 Tax=Naasia lichenicola TaxID=2565933 RepID=A0A4V3WT56_9MICO|nr:hypothetical protein [Naasia lichenicola]THG30697.1 hypothetical protein E6C64_08635 [Naasia lichenicola]THG31934.1 hypothetical protein E6C64_07780 [Naasia lichenicola]